jgi:diaminopimelate decarboxylase
MFKTMHNNTDRIKYFENLETPFYYYDMDVLNNVLSSAINEADKYGYHIHYAMKANTNPRILDSIQSYGFGADCVSGNEVLKAVEHNFEPSKIAFAGVGKSDREIMDAIESNIGVFHVESLPELEVINEIAGKYNKVVDIALRLNPNVDAKTHSYITTGLNENKFGINPWELDAIVDVLKTLNNLNFIGLHFHIGSQITDMEVFAELSRKVNYFVEWFEENDLVVNYINLGGGLGVDYENTDNVLPDFEKFFSVINQNLNVRESQTVHFELGRSLVATCGELLTRVLYVKKGLNKKFAIVDAGMNNLMRPALYKAQHNITNESYPNNEVAVYDVVGPVCESSDTFAVDFSLPECSRGNLLSIRTTGAYGEVMSSNYNLRENIMSYFSDK